ncbi:hypothetical protein ACP4OV_031294 [Aristida adscensionis]
MQLQRHSLEQRERETTLAEERAARHCEFLQLQQTLLQTLCSALPTVPGPAVPPLIVIITAGLSMSASFRLTAPAPPSLIGASTVSGGAHSTEPAVTSAAPSESAPTESADPVQDSPAE